MDEKRDIISVPTNGPFIVSGDQSEEREEGVGERNVRPGFGNVCFAESPEVRDVYKAGSSVDNYHQE
jgi:hypothetical protein